MLEALQLIVELQLQAACASEVTVDQTVLQTRF